MYNFTTFEVVERYISLYNPDQPSERIYSSNRRVVLENESDLRYWEHYDIHLNCTFIFSSLLENVPEAAREFNLKAAGGCDFISFLPTETFIRIKVDYWFYGSELNPAHRWTNYVSPRLICNSTLFEYGGVDYNCTENLDDVRKIVVRKAAEEEQNYTRFFYKHKLYSFGKNSFVGGVELEVPMHECAFDYRKINTNDWLKNTDNSQIQGNLEVVSKPYSLPYLTQTRFRDKIESLYKMLDVPRLKNLYSSKTTACGSGIHIHISWHRANAALLPASLLRDNYYSVCEALGGSDYLLSVGGKSLKQFKAYSPWRKGYTAGEKFDCVHVLHNNHLELRWLANDPNPQVVFKRIQAAVDIFRKAVVQSIRQQIETTSVSYLWKTQPEILLKKPLPQQPQTAPRLA